MEEASTEVVEDGQEPAAERSRGRRSHHRTGRQRRVSLRLSEEEHAVLLAASATLGLTPAGFAAEAALAAAGGEGVPDHAALRAALVELMAARTQVRRYGVNVNQAVLRLNAGEPAPRWLAGAVEKADRAVARVDAAAAEVAEVLRRRRR